jgi:hypothetical protein
MNRLLSFTPEPFETELEFENAPQVRGAARASLEREQETRKPARPRRPILPRPTSSFTAAESVTPAFDSEGLRHKIRRDQGDGSAPPQDPAGLLENRCWAELQ